MDPKLVKAKPMMKMADVLKVSDKVLEAQIARILAAEKSGDTKEMSDALRRGGYASLAVEKSAVISANPKKYEEAAKNLDEGRSTMVNADDVRAKAEGFLRFKSAKRSLSAVTKVESFMSKAIADAKPRVRKSRGTIVQ